MSENVLGMWVAINMQIKDEFFLYLINSKIDRLKYITKLLNHTHSELNRKRSNLGNIIDTTL